MVKVNRVILDVKTGETTVEQYEFVAAPPPEHPPTYGSLDLEKLKDVLLAKGVIATKAEVEPTGVAE